MKISEELEKSGQKVLEAVNETEVEGLGLLKNEASICIASFLEEESYLKQIEDNVRLVITKADLAERVLETGRGVCVVEKPKLSFFKLHNYLVLEQGSYILERHKNKYGNECQISKTAQIAQYNVELGNHVVIEDNVVIYENTRIEDNVVIHAGAVIGGEGFECKRDNDIIFTVKHAGSTIIRRGSEIRYNTCIDKAVYPWDSTRIGEYSILDNLVHIGHGVKIGKRNLIAAGSVIAGRTVTGEDVWIGVGSTVSNGLCIGNNCKIDIGSVVIKSILEGMEVYGNPARVIKNRRS